MILNKQKKINKMQNNPQNKRKKNPQNKKNKTNKKINKIILNHHLYRFYQKKPKQLKNPRNSMKIQKFSQNFIKNQ